jgi:hypothetical protein
MKKILTSDLRSTPTRSSYSLKTSWSEIFRLGHGGLFGVYYSTFRNAKLTRSTIKTIFKMQMIVLSRLCTTYKRKSRSLWTFGAPSQNSRFQSSKSQSNQAKTHCITCWLPFLNTNRKSATVRAWIILRHWFYSASILKRKKLKRSRLPFWLDYSTPKKDKMATSKFSRCTNNL